MVVEENILIFSTEAEEYNENLHKVALLLRGECGLLFTNEKTEDVLEFFQNLAEPDYARWGGQKWSKQRQADGQTKFSMWGARI